MTLATAMEIVRIRNSVYRVGADTELEEAAQVLMIHILKEESHVGTDPQSEREDRAESAAE